MTCPGATLQIDVEFYRFTNLQINLSLDRNSDNASFTVLHRPGQPIPRPGHLVSIMKNTELQLFAGMVSTVRWTKQQPPYEFQVTAGSLAQFTYVDVDFYDSLNPSFITGIVGGLVTAAGVANHRLYVQHVAPPDPADHLMRYSCEGKQLSEAISEVCAYLGYRWYVLPSGWKRIDLITESPDFSLAHLFLIRNDAYTLDTVLATYHLPNILCSEDVRIFDPELQLQSHQYSKIVTVDSEDTLRFTDPLTELQDTFSFSAPADSKDRTWQIPETTKAISTAVINAL